MKYGFQNSLTVLRTEQSLLHIYITHKPISEIDISVDKSVWGNENSYTKMLFSGSTNDLSTQNLE